MSWIVIERDGERQVIAAEPLLARGKALPPDGYEGWDVVETHDDCPCDPAGETALQRRNAEAWVDALPAGVLDVLAERIGLAPTNKQERQD